MIHRPRKPGSCPASLDPAKAGGTAKANESSLGAKEKAEVIKWIKENRPKEKRPGFKAYKGRDVAPALEALFGGRCAYCETPYSNSHPVDVEHWRPKSEVQILKDGKLASRHGYEWLAMEWDNLLPSCIDCNRPRTQLEPLDNGQYQKAVMGKANQFPVVNEADRLVSHLSLQSEQPLLLDPCTDNPADYFDFTLQGVVLPKKQLDDAQRLRATETIRVCALNRKGLVEERLRHLAWLEEHLRLVKFLWQASGNEDLPTDHRAAAADLAAESLARLRDGVRAGMPYSQFISSRLRVFLMQDLQVQA